MDAERGRPDPPDGDPPGGGDGPGGDGPGGGDLLAQWRRLLQQVTESTGRLSGGIGQAAAGVSRVPWPGALSAAQMAGITSAVRAQRHTLQALQSQLSAFDQQLEVLEQLVEPLTEWTAAWARLEGAVRPDGPPAADGPGGAGGRA